MDNIFFILSKVLWAFIDPENIIIFSLIIAFALVIFKQHALAHKLIYSISAAIIIIALLPIGGWLLYPLETQFGTQPKLPKHIDGIILLGGSFKTQNSQAWNKTQTNRYAGRIHSFITLKHQYPNAKAVFSGGKANIKGTYPAEAFYAQKLFNAMGINDVIYESNARNTYENILYSKQIVQPKHGENWIVVTSAFHLPRTIGVFCQQKWPVIPYPADFHTNPDTLFKPGINLNNNLNLLKDAIHEWIGLIAYYLTNKTTALLPGQCV